jgi:ADP-heptose:LPS heptosyltransferase
MTTTRTDCRHYRPHKPCDPHKQANARCHDCAEYDPVAERVLIVKLDAMGDVLRSTACLAPLKGLYPRSHVTWVTRTEAVSLLDGNPWVDRVLAVESNYLEYLLTEHFDLALGPDLDPLSTAIMGLAHADTKRGFVCDGRGGVTPLNDAARAWSSMSVDDALKKSNRRTYGNWLYDICELPAPVARPSFQPTPRARARAKHLLHGRAPEAQRRVCFNTGAGRRWQEKRWRAHHYVEFARMIADDDPHASVLLLGGPGEIEFNRALVESYPGFVDGGVENSVDDFAALIEGCDWVLTGDSLGYHVACAVATPATCLVGPTSPWELDLYGINQVLHPQLDCIACYLPRCPFSTTCMDALTPEFVWARVAEWRSRTAVPQH